MKSWDKKLSTCETFLTQKIDMSGSIRAMHDYETFSLSDIAPSYLFKSYALLERNEDTHQARL